MKQSPSGMSLEFDVAVQEAEELWGKEFYEECLLDAYELRKGLHEKYGLILTADKSEMPVTLVLSVAIAKLLKK